MKPQRISLWFWRRWLVQLAFIWNLSNRPVLSKIAWRMSRWFASDNTHAALAAYCSGIMINARLNGEYEDKTPAVSEQQWIDGHKRWAGKQ